MNNELFATLYGAVQEFVEALDEETLNELKEALFNRKYQQAENVLETIKKWSEQT